MNYNLYRNEYLKLRPDAGEDEIRGAYASEGIGAVEAFERGIGAGFHQTLGGFGTVGEMLGLPTDQFAEGQYKKAQQYTLPEELQGRVWDNPELLKDPSWWAYQTGQVLPSIASSFLPATAAFKGASMLPKLAPYARAIGAGVGGVAGGALEGAGTYRETGDVGQALAMGGASTILNSIPMAQILGGGSIPSRIIKGAVGEAVTEWAEEPTEALITGQDPIEAMKTGVNVIPGAFAAALLMGAPGAAMQAVSPEKKVEQTRPEAAPTLDDAIAVYNSQAKAAEEGTGGDFARPVKFNMATAETNYRGMHTAPTRDDDTSAPLNDLTNVFPEDIYSPKGAQYYGHYGQNNPVDVETVGIMRRFRGKPDATVTIYRAVPHEPTALERITKLEKEKAAYMRTGRTPGYAREKGMKNSEWYEEVSREIERLSALPGEEAATEYDINPGDWVTINRKYAKEHGESVLEGDYRILSKKVKASEIFTNGDSIHEWGYDPGASAKRDEPFNYINSEVGVVVAETVPSTSTPFGAQLAGATKAARDEYTKQAASILRNSNNEDVILAALNKKPVAQGIGEGTFEGVVSPNIQTGIVATRQEGDGSVEYDDEVADLYALSMMYIYEQDGVPWMRFDPKADGEWVAHGARVRFSELNGDTVERFYEHLQNYIRGGEFTVLGEDVVTLNFSDMTNEEFDAAFTKAVNDFDVPATEIVGGLKSKGNYHDIQEYTGESKWSDEEAAKRALEDAISGRGRPDLLPLLRDRNAAAREIDSTFTPQKVASYNLDLSASELKELGGDLRTMLFQSDGWDRRKSNIDLLPVEDIAQEDIDGYMSSYTNVVPIHDPHLKYRAVDLQERVQMTRLLKSVQLRFPYDITKLVDGIGIIEPTTEQGNGTYAQYVARGPNNPSMLLVSSRFINAMQSSENADLGPPLASAMLHELGHALDIGSKAERGSHAMQASAFFIDPLDVGIVPADNRRGGRVVPGTDAVGPLMKEVLQVWGSKKAVALGLDDYFDYPLLRIGQVALRGKIWDTPIGEIPLNRKLYDSPLIDQFVALVSSDLNMIQAEVFAQLHSLYYTDPNVMEEHMPKSFKFMQEVEDVTKTANSLDEIDRGLSAALRASRAKRGFARTAGNYNWQTAARNFDPGAQQQPASGGVGAGAGGVHPQQAQQNQQAPVPVTYRAETAGQQPPPSAPDMVERSRAGVAPADLAQEAKRGVQGWEATENLARVLGVNPQELDRFLRREIGTAFNAEQLQQAAMNITKQWHDTQVEFMGMVRKLDEGEMTDKDWVRAEELLHEMNAAQAQFMGVRGEAGRALQIFNKIRETTKMSDAVQKILEAHGGRSMLESKIRAISTLTEPGAGVKAVREEMAVTKWDKFMEWYVNSLVSGIPTHVVNTTSNMLMSFLADVDRFVAAGFGMLHGGEKVTFQEAVAHAAATLPGAVAGTKAFGEAIKDENSPLQFQGKFDQVHRQAIGGKVGKVVRIPTRFLGAEDAIFKTLAMTKELYALAARHGISIEEARANQDLVDQAWAEGLDRTFTNRPGPLAKALLSARRRIPALNIIFPFVTTPANIVTLALKHTPLALGYSDVRKAIKAGGVKRDIALAKIATGSGVGAAVMGLAAMGVITGAPPEDPNRRRLWYASGNQPYSLKIGDTWVSYSRLEPVGMLFGISADMYRLANIVGTDEADKLGTLLIGSISNNLFSKTYLRGLSDAINAITDPERYGERWMKSVVTGIATPVFLSYTAKATDPNLREAETILEALQARIPGASKALEPRLDVFGRERVSEGSGAYRMFSPAYLRKDVQDPVARELLRLGVSMPEVGKKMLGVDLSTAHRNELKRLLGGAVYGAVTRVMAAKKYKQLPDPVQAWVLDKVVSGVRRYGRLYWQMRHPDVMQEAERLKAEKMLSRGG